MMPRAGDEVPAVLDRYFRSWREMSIPLVRTLWWADATYRILGGREFRGLDQIVGYWEENSREQREVECSPRRWWVSADMVFAEWDARFFRQDKGQHYALNGFLWLRERDEKILEFSECFAKRVG